MYHTIAIKKSLILGLELGLNSLLVLLAQASVLPCVLAPRAQAGLMT